MNEILVDVAKTVGKKIADYVIDEVKWKNLFLENGKQEFHQPEKTDSFHNDLRTAFSEEYLKDLAAEMKEVYSYDFSERLKEKLWKRAEQLQLNRQDAEGHIEHYIQSVLFGLKQAAPDVLLENNIGGLQRTAADTNEVAHDTNAMVRSMAGQLTQVMAQTVQAQTKPWFTIEEIDRDIRNRSYQSRLGLDYFQTDDEDFSENLKKLISNERVYIIGANREETLYRVLYELREHHSNRPVKIIFDSTDWEYLRNTHLTGNILIPFLEEEEIYEIPGNTNLLILEKSPRTNNSKYLRLRRRTTDNLKKCIHRAGWELDEAYQLVKSTHGCYQPLKRRLFDYDDLRLPEWAARHSDAVLAALLCGGWRECDGDKAIVSLLAGKPYEACIRELEPYFRGEYPLLRRADRRGETKIYLTCAEDAWADLDEYITGERWMSFLEVFQLVMGEVDPLYELPIEQHHMGTILAKKPECSGFLKKGMTNSLCLHLILCENERDLPATEQAVKSFLDGMETESQWAYLSNYISPLCEAVPNVVMKVMEEELQKENSGLVMLFEHPGGDFLFGVNYYTHYLLAAELLVQMKPYSVRSVKWLMEMDNRGFKYPMSNSPKDLLERIFCPFCNETALPLETKRELARYGMMRCPDFWSVLNHWIGTRNQMYQNFTFLRYQKAPPKTNAIVAEYRDMSLLYLQLCIEYAKGNSAHWCEIIEELCHYSKETEKESLKQMVEQSYEMEDSEKIRVKDKLREFIYLHRYFGWDTPEERLAEYETAMNQIVPENPVYDYVYLFSPDYEFPLLHPVPDDKEDFSGTKNSNDEKRRNELTEQFKAFKEKGLPIEPAIQMAFTRQNHDSVGAVLAEFYSEFQYDPEILRILLREDISGWQARRYLGKLTESVLPTALEDARSAGASDVALASILSCQIMTAPETALIASEDEAVKRAFWKTHSINCAKEAEERFFLWCLEECRKYGTLGSYSFLLFSFKEILSDGQFYDYCMSLKEMDGAPNGHHRISDVLKEAQKRFMDDPERRMNIAGLEWYFSPTLRWDEMKCLQREVKDNPGFYVAIVTLIYKDDEGNDFDEEGKKQAQNLYQSFYKMKFCPGERAGTVDRESLNRWVERFSDLLKENHRTRLFGTLLGELFAHSPAGEDGCYPAEPVREIIEKYNDTSMKTEYEKEICNQRGFFSCTNGKGEKELAARYQANAEKLEVLYPHTAEIYFNLAKSYLRDSKEERRQAEEI